MVRSDFLLLSCGGVDAGLIVCFHCTSTWSFTKIGSWLLVLAGLELGLLSAEQGTHRSTRLSFLLVKYDPVIY